MASGFLRASVPPWRVFLPESRTRMKRAQVRSVAAKKSRKKRRLTLIEKDYPGGKLLEFPGMKGRKLEKIELVTSGDYHCISLSFQHKKTLHLMIDPGFTLKAH